MMQREIKFRGLRIDGKGWVYGMPLYGNINDDITEIQAPTSLGGDILEVFSESVGQFTGLKDRNGKDIYEGDLVNVPYNYIGINEVKYIEEECMFSISKYKISVLEIIGNIHEQQSK